MLPVHYRYKVFIDPRNDQIYCSNGPYLELFTLVDNIVVFKKSWKILNDGEAITNITDYSVDDNNYNSLVISSDGTIVVFNLINETNIAVGQCSDRVISSKVLISGEILILVGLKRLLTYEINDYQLVLTSSLALGTKSTVFSGLIIGENLDNLAVYTGNVMGIIETFEPRRLSGLVDSKLIIRGNDGMIFGIQVYRNRIYSISDDRSVRVFDNNTGEQLGICYGHETRPRSLLVIPGEGDEEEVFSGAEIVNKWAWKNGELVLVDRHEPDIGCIYTLGYIHNVLLMGSVNGAFYGLDTKKDQMRKYIIQNLDDLIIRSFIRIGNDEYYVIDDKRNLYYLNGETRSIFIENNHLKFETLKLSVHNDFAVATTDRKIFFIDIKKRKYATILTDNVLGGVVFAGNDLIASSNIGNAVILRLINGILHKEEMKLSMRKHLTSALIYKGYYILGFGLGSLVVCNDKLEEMFHYKVCKSKRGDPVSDMKVINERLFVITKDGRYTVFDMDNFPLLRYSETSPIFDTPTRFYIDKHTKDEYLWGFRSVDFILTRLHSPSPIVSFDCRGGNRICGLYSLHSNDKLIGFKFEYVAQGVLVGAEFNLTRIQNIVGPYHRHTIFGLATMKVRDRLQILTAGVDTDIHLHELDESGRAMRKWMTSYHTSSIHSINTVRCKNNDVLITTAGGSSQIKVWKNGDGMLIHLSDYNDDVHYRYVSVQIIEYSERIFVIGAASIREVHLFELMKLGQKYELKKINTWKCLDYSTIIKLDTVISNEFVNVYAAATSGMVYCMIFNSEMLDSTGLKNVISVNATDCGLSAITAVGEKYAVTGDESGCLTLIDVEEPKRQDIISGIHFSTVPDVCCKQRDSISWIIASVSTDFVFSLSEVKLNEVGQFDKFNVIKTSVINVGDPMVLIPVDGEDNGNNYLVGGQGFEMVAC